MSRILVLLNRRLQQGAEPRGIAPMLTVGGTYRGFVFAHPDRNVIELYQDA